MQLSFSFKIIKANYLAQNLRDVSESGSKHFTYAMRSDYDKLQAVGSLQTMILQFQVTLQVSPIFHLFNQIMAGNQSKCLSAT